MLQRDPSFYRALFFMAFILSGEGRHKEALVGYYGCLALHPNDVTALANRSLEHLELGHFDEAQADAERAMTLAPQNFVGYSAAAWCLATSPDSKYRNGRRAVKLATKACELSKYAEVYSLDSLAAAYAEVGDFPNAVKRLERALELEYHSKNREQLTKELESFRHGKPWRVEVKQQ